MKLLIPFPKKNCPLQGGQYNPQNPHHNMIKSCLLSGVSVAMLFLFLGVTPAQAGEWETDTEFGLVSQRGNTEQNNTYAKTKWEKQNGDNKYTASGEYINSSGRSNGQKTRLSESANAGIRYTRELSETLGLFSGALWEKNRFSGFENRYSGELGAAYKVFKTDLEHLTTEFGYRYRNQYQYLIGPGEGPNTESNFARVYLEYGRKISETSKFKFWIDNLYDFSNSENYEVSFEPSVDVFLGEFFLDTKPARMSLKVAYKGVFDNVPASDGLKRYDSTFTTSLKILY